MAIQCFHLVESRRHLVGGKIRAGHVIRRYLKRPVGWIDECPIHIGINWFASNNTCRLTAFWVKILVGCIVYRGLMLIKCGILVAREVQVRLVFKVLDVLIPLLVRKWFLLDGSHLESERQMLTETALITDGSLYHRFGTVTSGC